MSDRSVGSIEWDDGAEQLVRAGWLAKGLIFVTIGFLGIDIARRSYSSEDADQTGALSTIAGAPAGRAVVFIVAVGLLLYAVWQVWSAASSDADDEDSELLTIIRRIGMVGLGGSYALLAATGLQIAWRGGRAASDDGGASPESIATFLLSAPAGRWALVVLGLGTIAVGCYHLWKGLSFEFLEDIDDSTSSRARHVGLVSLGVLGFCSRSAMLAIAGGLFVVSAVRHDPEESAGLDESLRIIAEAPFGRWLLGAASVGLVAAGVYDAITFRRQQLD